MKKTENTEHVVRRLTNNHYVEVSGQELLNNYDKSVNKSKVRDIVIVDDVENFRRDPENLKWK